MRVNLNTVDQSQFMVTPHIVNGETLWLVTPNHIGVKWTPETLMFRSSLWSNEGELVSAGFKKFFNWQEQPDLSPVPKSLKGCNIVEKLDGSLLIVSKYKGNVILRTRGTVDASALDNGYELQTFRETYLKRLDDNRETWPCSYLFEWVSPTQRIILNYGENPAWHLIGAVDHIFYSLWTQERLDKCANFINAERPITYTFPDVETLLADIDKWKGKEGIVVYSNGDQVLHKVKCAEYLAKHRFKSQATLENTVDIFFSLETPSYTEFERKLVETFDYECFEMVRGHASNICDAWKNVSKIVEGMQKFVDEKLRPLSTRRQQAELVLSAYSVTSRSSMVFTLLDSKPLNDEQLKKLLYQSLKKS